MGKGTSKFQTILLITFGACAVGGVLIFAFAIGGNTNNAIGSITVWGTFDASAFQTILRQASEGNTSLSGVRFVQKDPETYEQELAAALASGTGPDIFVLRSDYAMNNAGKAITIPFTSLPQTQFEANFIEAALPLLSKNLGGVIAVPFLADPLVLYWNRDLLQAAGYAKPPSYWDEVIPMATYLTSASGDINKSAVTVRDSANAIKKSAIAFGEFQNVENAKDILATLILQAGGHITTVDDSNHVTPSLVTQAGAAGASAFASESALRYFTEFSNPTKNHYSWNRSLPSARTAFAAGDVGLYVGYASEMPQIRKTNPNLNFAAAPLPQIRGGARPITFAHVYGFAISRAGPRPNAAIVVASLLANAQLSAGLSTVYGIPSARRDVLAQPVQGESDLFNRSALIARAWIDPNPSRTDEIFRGMIENTTSGAASMSEAVQRADQELAQLLRQ